MNPPFGKRIAEERNALELSQLDLAVLLGVSQAKVSRIEASDECPSDIRLIAKIARALKLPVSSLLPEDFLYGNGSDETFFFAFCPNPMCAKNARTLAEGQPRVVFKSATQFDVACFDRVNFCKTCGTELIKECPGCERKLTDGVNRYCMTCGQKIYPEISEDQWKEIARDLQPTVDDDIPF